MRAQKKWLPLIAIGLVLLGCQIALADDGITVRPAPAERIQVHPEPGVVVKAQMTEGNCHLLIDTERSDWFMAITYGGTSEVSPLGAYIQPPVGAAYCVYADGQFDNDQDVRDAIAAVIEQAESYGGSPYFDVNAPEFQPGYIYAPYRTYSQEQEILAFNTFVTEEAFTQAVCWYDENKKPLCAETLRYRIDFTSSQSRSVKPYLIAAADITPNTNQRTGITCTLKDGELVYSVTPEALGNKGDTVIKTRIKAPEKAVRMIRYNYFGDPQAVDGDESHLLSDGYVEVYISFKKDQSTLCSGILVEYGSYAFLDEKGNFLPGGGKLDIIRINENDCHPALYYTDWQSIPSERLNAWIEQDSGLLRLTYQDGLVHLSAVEKSGFSEKDARKLPQAVKYYRVTPPAGARSYRVARLGGPDCFRPEYANEYQSFLLDIMRDSELRQVSGNQAFIDEQMANVFFEASTSANGVQLYMVALETEPGRATFIAVQWYSDTQGETPLQVEWIAENADPITLKPNTYVYRQRDEIKSAVDGPALVDKGGHGWRLYAGYRPQDGSHSYVIDLELRDENGNPVKNFDELSGNEPVEFMIPYPVGYSYGMPVTYRLTHYFAVNMLEREAVAEMSMEKEGILFRVKSLSPIELSWQENAQPTPKPEPTPGPVPAAPPKTAMPLPS